MLIIPKESLIMSSELQSFIKAEWDSVRVNQSSIKWNARDSRVKRLDEIYCGILFLGDYAYSTNGHWLLRIRVDGPPVIESTSYFFYSFPEDDVIENYNPYEEYLGLNFMIMNSIVSTTKAYEYTFSIDIHDLLSICNTIPIVRDKRYYILQIQFNQDKIIIRIARTKTHEIVSEIYTDYASGVGFLCGVTLSLNLAYMYKLSEYLLSEGDDTVEFRFLGVNGKPVHIHGFNRKRLSNKQIEFVLSQYKA